MPEIIFDPVPNRHISHLPHQRPRLVELKQELFHFVRLRAAGPMRCGGGRDKVDQNRDRRGLLLGHGIDHALDAFDGDVGVFALGNQIAHAGPSAS